MNLFRRVIHFSFHSQMPQTASSDSLPNELGKHAFLPLDEVAPRPQNIEKDKNF